jgi:hypothetical protein
MRIKAKISLIDSEKTGQERWSDCDGLMIGAILLVSWSMNAYLDEF